MNGIRRTSTIGRKFKMMPSSFRKREKEKEMKES